MRILLPYGHTHIPVEVDDLATVLAPAHLAPDPVRLALAAPIGSPPLHEIVRPGQKVVIVTSDVTRPCPTPIMLPPVVEELDRAGISRDDVTLVFGLGTHRRQTPDEHARLMGTMAGCIRAMDADPERAVYVGTTSFGTPIEVFEPVVRADVRIALGNVEYHYFAGYSGGAKALVPGVCSNRTVQHNHAMMTRPEARQGRLDDNPVRQDLEEGAALVGLDFILNVIMAEHEIALAVAGHPVAAHRWACRVLDFLNMAPVEDQADIVLVSAGGYPKDINLYQAQKALDNAAGAVKPGGIIIWVAECREGMGNATFEKWMVGSTPDELIRRIQAQFVIGGHKAAAIACVQKQAAIWLVSSLSPECVRACGMLPYADVAVALRDALAQIGRGARLLVMPEGPSIVPQVVPSRRCLEDLSQTAVPDQGGVL